MNTPVENILDYHLYIQRLKSSISVIDYQISEIEVISNSDLIKSNSLTKSSNKLKKELLHFRSYLFLRLTIAELKHSLTEIKPLNKTKLKRLS